MDETRSRLSSRSVDARLFRRVRSALPAGDTLGLPAWRRRHRWIAGLLGAHAALLPLYAVSQEARVVHALAETLPVIVLAAIAWWPRLGTVARSLAATLGLVISSTLLVHLSGGFIEMHFHFFVVVFVVSLYHSWQPFLLSLGVVLSTRASSSRPAPCA